MTQNIVTEVYQYETEETDIKKILPKFNMITDGKLPIVISMQGIDDVLCVTLVIYVYV